MSVKTQIDRLTKASTDIKAAIAEKGVSVPAGTKLDGYPALIKSIEAGGGGGASVDTCEVEIRNSNNDIDDFIYPYMFGTKVVDGVPVCAMSNGTNSIMYNTKKRLLDALGGGDGILVGSMFGLWMKDNRNNLNISTSRCELVGSWEKEFYLFKIDEKSVSTASVYISFAD